MNPKKDELDNSILEMSNTISELKIQCQYLNENKDEILSKRKEEYKKSQIELKK